MRLVAVVVFFYNDAALADVTGSKISIYGIGPFLEENLHVWAGNPLEMGDFGDNPILGRQTCPSLTRLNLSQGKSEPLLLAALTEHRGEGVQWIFVIKRGLFWWGGAAVTLEDVMEFVQSALPKAIAHVGGGLWSIPEFKITKKSEDSFEVRWSLKPEFGPFVLNGLPLARLRKSQSTSEKSNRIECAGLYIPEVSAGSTKFIISPHYKSTKPLPQIEAYMNGDAHKQTKENDGEIALVMNGIWNYEKEVQCSIEADEPMITAVVWNPIGGVAEDPEFRRLIDQLIPRDNIADIIGRKFVTPLDSLILRGFPRRDEARPDQASHDVLEDKESHRTKSRIERVAFRLQQLGYSRPDPRGPRTDRSGKPIELLIVTRSRELGLIEKVIEDILSSVGISVRFVISSARNPIDGSRHHAILSTFRIDWPGSNLLPSLHSRVVKKGIFQSFRGTPQLDTVLEKYAIQLTHLQPDFAVMNDIEAELAKISGISVLMQHRLCLKIGKKAHLATLQGVSQNPDWFRNLLLTL